MTVEDSVRLLLQAIGEDPTREGLRQTPNRVAAAFSESWLSGYGKEPGDVLKCFEDGAKGYSEMVLVRDLPVYSLCEHHMAPFWGRAHVGYIPNGRLVGLSKLGRVVDIFARRLQVQERLTAQVAETLDSYLKPTGVGVILECRHMCIESRGLRAAGSVTVTSSLSGAVKDDPRTRAEFLALVGDARPI